MTTEQKAMTYDVTIPFGAKDSELIEEVYVIPKGMEAVIQDDRVIIRRKESEDESIRKWIINEIKIKHHNLDEDNVDFVDKAISWLEKQGKQKPIDTKLPEFKDKLCELFQRFRLYKNENEIPTNGDILEYVDAHIQELLAVLIEQKPVGWSEKDEMHLGDAIHAAEETYSEHCGREELVDWLKSLSPQSK